MASAVQKIRWRKNGEWNSAFVMEVGWVYKNEITGART